MALPNEEELALIVKLRGRVAEILTKEDYTDDLFLVRWLRARDLNIDKAEQMLRNAMKWRKDNHLDERVILDSPSSSFYAANFPYYLDGMDKVGRPVTTIPFGCWDARKILAGGNLHEFQLYLTNCYDAGVRASKRSTLMHTPKNGKPPYIQIIVIVDWQGFAFGQLLSYQNIQNFLQIASIYEAYYPEIVSVCYFINCPKLLSSLLSLLKPVTPQRTMDKINCFGTDKDEWSKEILELINPDQLRPQFGGTKTDNHNPFL